MAKTITYPRLPQTPRRQTPGKGQLAAIDDPVVRRLISDLQDRLSSVDKRFQDLDTFALKAGSPIPAYGQRIVNVGAPVHPNDAVPLWKLQQFVDTQAALINRAAGAGGGGEGGATGLDVPLPNLYQIVYDYAQANPTQLAQSCLAVYGPPAWDFMRGLVAALQAVDSRVGWCGQRGSTTDYSEDAICYWGRSTLPPINGETGNYVVDVIANHCGAAPGPRWASVAPAGAVWLAVAP